MEEELDTTFYWETILTKLGDPIRATELFCSVPDRTKLMHIYETEVLIPHLKRNKADYEPIAKAVLGDAEAQYQLGQQMLVDNKEEGLVWLQHAAVQNHVSAQVCLGKYFKEKRNTESALAYYRMAADQNHVDSMGDISSILYQVTHPTKEQVEEAFHWARKGHSLGSSFCSNELELWLVWEKNVEEAITVFCELLKKPNPHASFWFNFGCCYDEESPLKNHALAKECYSKAASMGHARAAEKLAY